MSQRRAGGHRVRGGPRALSQRRAGGVISREGGAATRELGNPPAGLGIGLGTLRAWNSHSRQRISPTIGGHEGSRPADSRYSRRSRRTPTPTCSGLWRDDERRLPCRGTNRTRTKQKTFENEKQNGVNGHRLRLVWSSVTVHTRGRNRNTQTRT